MQTSRFDYTRRIASFDARAVFHRHRGLQAPVFIGAVFHHAHARAVGLEDGSIARPAKACITFLRFIDGHAFTGIIVLLYDLVSRLALKVHAGKKVDLGKRRTGDADAYRYGDQDKH